METADRKEDQIESLQEKRVPDGSKRGNWYERRVDWILAGLSLVVALWALSDSNRSLKIAKQTSAGLEETSRNLSTRYIGQFPAFIPEVAEVLDGATKTIRIACDFTGYGIYSNHSAYIKYRQAVERRANDGVTVQMIVMDEESRNHMNRLQWAGMDITQLKDPANTAFRSFTAWSQCPIDKIATIEDFVKCMAEEHRRARIEDFRFPRATIKDRPGAFPLYLWIADDREAVFSVPNFAHAGAETAFRTRDARLIAELISIFNTYYEPPSTLSETFLQLSSSTRGSPKK